LNFAPGDVKGYISGKKVKMSILLPKIILDFTKLTKKIHTEKYILYANDNYLFQVPISKVYIFANLL